MICALCLPVDAMTPRRIEVADFAASDPATCTSRRVTALVIELTSAEEVAIVTTWLAELHQPKAEVAA